jgi:hypothetical protein
MVVCPKVDATGIAALMKNDVEEKASAIAAVYIFIKLCHTNKTARGPSHPKKQAHK